MIVCWRMAAFDLQQRLRIVFLFFVVGKLGSNRTPALRTESEEAVRPHKFTCRSALTAADAAARGPREPLPGHGHRHLSHSAAGLRQRGLYTVQHAARGL